MKRAFILKLLVTVSNCVVVLALFFPVKAFGQQIEKVSFDTKDTTSGYYLAIRPQSNNIKGAIILFTSFMPPEAMLPETRLHNVAYANDLLTIAVSMNQKFYADSPTTERLNTVLNHVVTKFKVDTASFTLAGYDFAGNIALRYTELTREQPSRFLVHPKAVLAVDSPVDLFGFWRWCERQLKRNSGSAGDARFILDLMTKENGTIQANQEAYQKLTPFYSGKDKPGNEKFLKNVPLRLYYDVDVAGQLKEKGNSLYDTNIPDGSELISRLLALGNQKAELITADRPGRNSRGIRTTSSLSIVNEVEAVHWIKNQLNIFDPNTWVPLYHLLTPKGWQEERFPIRLILPPKFLTPA